LLVSFAHGGRFKDVSLTSGHANTGPVATVDAAQSGPMLWWDCRHEVAAKQWVVLAL